MGLKEFFLGSPAKRENVSTLRPEQEGLFQQLQNAGMNKGAGGVFGTAADYYRGLLSDDNADYNAFAAPALRQYREEIVPGLSEQFAGMGAGGLSSSGFRNAQISGATDLAERLGALRANLRAQGAQGLMNIGQQGLQSYSQNIETQPGTGGILAPALGAVGTAIGGPFLGSVGATAGNAASNWFGGGGNKVGQNTGPYGQGGPRASPVAAGSGPARGGY